MKTFTKTLLAIITLLLNFNLNAAVLTVSNWSAIPAQYTSVQVAIDAANANDVLYVHGSPTSYGDPTINKTLTIIGAGINPTGQNQNKTTFSSILVNGASNCSFVGITTSSLNTGYSCLGVSLDRCNIGGLSYSGGGGGRSFTITNSFIYGGLNFSDTQDLLISNNYFCASSYITSGSPELNAAITNNAFIGGFTGSYYSNATLCGANSGNSLGILTNAIFTNNIFYGVPILPTLTNCVFNNNLTYATNNNTLVFPGAITVGTIVNANPGFVNMGDPLILPCNNYSNSGNSLSQIATYFNQINLALAPGSPALNTGLGGVNLGPTGGAASFDYRTQNRPRIPQMQSLIINNSAIPLGGTLNVQIQGQKQD